MPLKMPPPEKIYEAWSAIASGRARLLSPPDAPEGEAEVTSSNAQKKYHLRWLGAEFLSTDSATWWQGYPGYPVIAVLMLRGLLPLDRRCADLFAHVDWHAANSRARRDYAKAVAQVCADLNLSDGTMQEVAAAAQKAWQALQNLDISVGRYRKGAKK